MAKTPWQWLGLPRPTSDKKAIKRAYAQQLKVYHPEDHPEAFQALQAAYKKALQRATELAATEAGGAGRRQRPRSDSQPEAWARLPRPSDPDQADEATSSGPGASTGSQADAQAPTGPATPPAGTAQSHWQVPESTSTPVDGEEGQVSATAIDAGALDADPSVQPGVTGRASWSPPETSPDADASVLDWEAELEAADQETTATHHFYGFDEEEADQDDDEAPLSVFRQEEEVEAEPEAAVWTDSGTETSDYQVDIAALLAPFKGFLDDRDLRSIVENPQLMTQLRQHHQLDDLDQALAQLAITEHKGRRKRLKELAKAHGLTRLVKRIGWRLPEAPHWRLYFVIAMLVVGPLIHQVARQSPSSPPRTAPADLRSLPSLPISSISLPNFSFSLSLDSLGSEQDETLDRLTGPTGNQSLWIGEVERLTEITTVLTLENNSHLLKTQDGQLYLHLGPSHRLIGLYHYQAAKRVIVSTEDKSNLEGVALQTNGTEPTWYLIELSEGRAVAPITGTIPNGETGRVKAQVQSDPITAEWQDAP